MKSVKRISFLSKVLLGLVMFVLFSFVKVDDAQAQSVTEADLQVVEADHTTDLGSIIEALEGKELTDGSTFIVGDYRFECEVIIEPIIDSKASANVHSSGATTLATTTSSYSATSNVNAYINSTNTRVAVLTHTVSVTYYDNKKVHINSGSYSVSTLHSYYSGYSYGYTINNTDGSSSSAYGMVELYNSYDKLYSYIGSSVSVTPTSTPSFSFSQV